MIATVIVALAFVLVVVGLGDYIFLAVAGIPFMMAMLIRSIVDWFCRSGWKFVP
jgi:hypothetical protein